MKSFRTSKFKELFGRLPVEAQRLATKAYGQWKSDPNYPGVNFKPYKGVKGDRRVYEAYIGDHYRAFCYFQENEFVWFWIGSHEDANKLRV